MYIEISIDFGIFKKKKHKSGGRTRKQMRRRDDESEYWMDGHGKCRAEEKGTWTASVDRKKDEPGERSRMQMRRKEKSVGTENELFRWNFSGCSKMPPRCVQDGPKMAPRGLEGPPKSAVNNTSERSSVSPLPRVLLTLRKATRKMCTTLERFSREGGSVL